MARQYATELSFLGGPAQVGLSARSDCQTQTLQWHFAATCHGNIDRCCYPTSICSCRCLPHRGQCLLISQRTSKTFLHGYVSSRGSPMFSFLHDLHTVIDEPKFAQMICRACCFRLDSHAFFRYMSMKPSSLARAHACTCSTAAANSTRPCRSRQAPQICPWFTEELQMDDPYRTCHGQSVSCGWSGPQALARARIWKLSAQPLDSRAVSRCPRCLRGIL
jgi:hypothetical protein